MQNQHSMSLVPGPWAGMVSLDTADPKASSPSALTLRPGADLNAIVGVAGLGLRQATSGSRGGMSMGRMGPHVSPWLHLL